MTNDTRQEMRQVFFDAWEKYKTDAPLSVIEKQILHVIHAHPEYYPQLNNPEAIFENYTTDNNPFLHMGLHLSLLEQIQTNRPTGIQTTYQQLSKQLDNAHRAEHLMMEIMANIIWEAQNQGILPDEKKYLEELHKLIQ